MDIGDGCYISDRWVPKRIFTGFLDIEGKEIYTSDCVSLCGCTSKKAIIGRNENCFRLYFGSSNGSVGWDLNRETILKHNIRLL